jgi:anti-sigma-K factor RskA/putative zinc finger protein
VVDHDRMEDTVAAYVLDACDEAEREAVRVHIDGCPTCQALVARLTQVVDVLPLGSDVVRPPERLRGRILAAAAASPPTGQEPEPPRPVARRPPPPPGAAEAQPAASGRGWRRVRLPALTGVVAALAALGGMGAWNVSLQQQLSRPPAHYSSRGTGTLAHADASVMAYRRQDPAVVTCTGLPQAPPGRVYELWFIDASGRAAPAGTFTPDAGGRATVLATRPLADATEIAVTQEQGPEGAPTLTHRPELAVRVGS